MARAEGLGVAEAHVVGEAVAQAEPLRVTAVVWVLTGLRVAVRVAGAVWVLTGLREAVQVAGAVRERVAGNALLVAVKVELARGRASSSIRKAVMALAGGWQLPLARAQG